MARFQIPGSKSNLNCSCPPGMMHWQLLLCMWFLSTRGLNSGTEHTHRRRCSSRYSPPARFASSFSHRLISLFLFLSLIFYYTHTHTHSHTHSTIFSLSLYIFLPPSPSSLPLSSSVLRAWLCSIGGWPLIPPTCKQPLNVSLHSISLFPSSLPLHPQTRNNIIFILSLSLISVLHLNVWNVPKSTFHRK